MSTSSEDNARARARRPVINMAKADLTAYGPPDGSGPGATKFGAMTARLGPAIGAEKLGCTLSHRARQTLLALSPAPYQRGDVCNP